jgi:hypothetical protein
MRTSSTTREHHTSAVNYDCAIGDGGPRLMADYLSPGNQNTSILPRLRRSVDLLYISYDYSILESCLPIRRQRQN